MDDDIVVDFIRMFQQLLLENEGSFDKEEMDNTLFGYIQMGLPVQRTKGWKWALSREEFHRDIHPSFLSGWAYIITPTVARKLVNASKQTPFLWIDDVWITGILAAKAGLVLKSLNLFYTFYKEHIQCCVMNPFLECDYFVGPSENDLNVIRKFGEHSKNCWSGLFVSSYDIRFNGFQRECRKRKENQSIVKNCHVTNPYFLPDGKGVGEVF